MLKGICGSGVRSNAEVDTDIAVSSFPEIGPTEASTWLQNCQEFGDRCDDNSQLENASQRRGEHGLQRSVWLDTLRIGGAVWSTQIEREIVTRHVIRSSLWDRHVTHCYMTCRGTVAAIRPGFR